MSDTTSTRQRLEELRAAIRAENISYGELYELQCLAEHIDPDDVELLEWAGVPEFPDEPTLDDFIDTSNKCTWCNGTGIEPYRTT